jgi:hypothetical protein
MAGELPHVGCLWKQRWAIAPKMHRPELFKI